MHSVTEQKDEEEIHAKVIGRHTTEWTVPLPESPKDNVHKTLLNAKTRYR